MRPQLKIVLSFLIAIFGGALLLMQPFATVPEYTISLTDALFTATSAVCVTGLTVIDPGTQLTVYGQLILMVLVELGAIGVMTLGTFVLVVVGRRLSVASEFSLMNAYGVEQVKGLRGLVVWVVGSMFVCEALGAVAIWSSFTRGAPDLVTALADGDAWYRAAYYSVMGFCNAGFSLEPDSLIAFRTDPVFVCAMSALCIAGGLGFLVIVNLFTIKFWSRNLRTRGHLTLHSKVVLTVTSIVLFGGAALLYALERNGSLAGLSFVDSVFTAFGQNAIAHTAGFSVVSLDNSSGATRLLTELLMAIGGSPGSAAGGLKNTTVAVLLCTIVAMWRGRSETVMFRRTVPMEIVRESLVIFVVAMLAFFFALGALNVTEASSGIPGEKLVFEAVSALSTTGLSLGATSMLSIAGKFVVMLCMFTGRLGAITVVMLIGSRDEHSSIRYPNEEVVVG